MAPYELLIRVHHPAAAGRLRLRTQDDWERDVLPESAAGTRADFRLALDAPFVYFKPILPDGARVAWAQGENVLALPNGSPIRDVYPACGVRGRNSRALRYGIGLVCTQRRSSSRNTTTADVRS